LGSTRIDIHLAGEAEVDSLLAVGPPIPSELYHSPRRSPFRFAGRETSKTNEAQPPSESPLPPFAMPVQLMVQLKTLAQTPEAESWATDVLKELNTVARCEAEQHAEIRHSLDQLSALVVQADNLKTTDAQATWPNMAHSIKLSLARRIVLWQQLPLLNATQSQPAALKQNSAAQLTKAVTGLEAYLTKRSEGAGWRKYLQLEALSALAGAPRQIDAPESQKLMASVLQKLASYDKDAKQRQLMQEPVFVALREALWILTFDDQEVGKADELVEKYESQHNLNATRQIAALSAALRVQKSESLVDLGKWFELEYREANFRVAATTNLLNRLVSQERFTVTPVRDNILGADVRGHSQSATRLTVRPVPDENQIRLDLEAHGNVASDTEATSGPATFYSENHSTFLVRKRIELSKEGLKTFPAQANANAYADQLKDLSTNFDGMPIVESIVRNAARNRHEEARGDARRITEGRVAHRARVEVEDEVQKKLVATEARLRSQLLDPLTKLGICPEPVELATTDARLIARMRVADLDQLAADSPRPFAPSDSWLSLQAHESLINNFLQRLELGGKPMTLQEVYTQIADRLELKQVKPPEDLPEDVYIRFAETPFQVRFQGDRVELVVSMAELKQGNNRWKDFFVTYGFRVEASGMQLRILRDKAIQLGGESLKGKPQIVLRGIFSKALPRDHEWPLFPDDLVKDKRLEDLVVSQLLIRDGWLATAWSQKVQSRDIANRPGNEPAKKK
jgi:hypothetical protein